MYLMGSVKQVLSAMDNVGSLVDPKLNGEFTSREAEKVLSFPIFESE